MNVKEILVDLTLFNSLINRAIYNQCEIVLFNEASPENFEVEIADLASRHADTVTVYKSLDGKTMFASDLHFNPYNVKVIANVHKDFKEKFYDLLDDKSFELNGKGCHITDVRFNKDEEELRIEYTVEENDKSSFIDSFYYWLQNNRDSFKSDDFQMSELENLWVEFNSAQEEQEEFKNQPEYGTDLGLLKLLYEHADDVQTIYKEYSGRGMYGKTCFGIIVEPYTDLETELEKYDVMGHTDNMGRDIIIYWPGKTYESLKAKDTNGVLSQFDSGDDEAEAKKACSAEYALKPLISELESKGYTVLDEGSHQDITLYVANSKEEFADDIFLALIFGNEELVDIVDSNFQALYAGKYAEIEEIAKKHEKKDETEAVRMESLADAGDCYKIIKQPIDVSATSFAEQMVFEALESAGGEACESEIKKVIDDQSLWGYYQKSNPGTLRRARENPDLIKNGLEELIKDGYVALSDGKSEALHPEQKGGQEIKLRKIAEKYIDEVAKHANTGIVQHAILDASASDLNKEQIASVKKALVEVGNRNMGNDRVRKEGKEGVIAGSDIAEWASWITSDCMALTADYLMESIGNRNAQETYTFAKAKLEDCLMDFYRNEMNKSNYDEVYKFWEDLIYGQKAFGASEGDDFFTVYLMKEKTPEEIQSMCKSVEEQFKTECAIVDNSAFNVYKLGKLKGNESAKTEVASLIGQSEVLEMA